MLKLEGPPAACRGRLESRIDDEVFGTLRFDWRSGIVFEAKSAPPESSELSLRNPNGFAESAQLSRYLREYVQDRGIRIDWEKPVTTSIQTGSITKYESSEQGTNASVILEYDKRGNLLKILLLLAL